MKVVFLDIDGVLNEAYSKSRAPSGFIGIDDAKVENLRRIIDATGAVIVLTSTWKKDWHRNPELTGNDGKYLNRKLARQGLHIFDKTDDQIFDRGAGIARWLNEHSDVTSWVVLDDDTFADFESNGIMEHFVHTSFVLGGLTNDHVRMSIEMLMKEA